MQGFLSLDVGGTKIKAAIVCSDGRLLLPVEEYSANAAASKEALLDRFFGIIQAQLDRAAAERLSLLAGCIGFPGPFDYAQGICRLRALGKYDALYGVNLRRLWEEAFGLPFYFFNDAALFVAGACNLSEGRRFQKVFGVCLGTGIGSAFYDRPRLVLQGANIPHNGYIYNLPFKEGILDQYLSATGLRRKIKEAGLPIPDVRELADLARAGNPVAVRIFQEFGEELSAALPNIAERFGAQCLILGGKISGAAELFAAPLRQRLEKSRIELLVLPNSSEFALRAAAFLPLGRGNAHLTV